MNQVAVITGDIINSRQILDKDLLFSVLKEVFKVVEQKFDSLIPFEIYRGDSFQGVLKQPKDALRVMLLIKNGLHYLSKKNSFKVRMSAGIGRIDYLNVDDVKVSNGKAFERSGIALDRMKKSGEVLAISTNSTSIDKTLSVMNAFTTAISERWTTNATEVIYLSLSDNMTQEAIAKQLGKSQSAIQQRLSAAHYEALRQYVDYFETQIQF